MQTKEERFDDFEGTEVKKFTLTNKNHVSISAISLGATFYEFLIPTGDQTTKNLVVNFEHSADYLANPYYFCMGIGRVAGRIANGTFPLNGKEYHVDSNEGTTTLHGGPHGFNSAIWDGTIANDKIVFERQIDSSYDSFPGNMHAKIEYGLTDDNEATITYTATSDADTVFNPTQHTYFNIGNTDNVLDHTMEINADKYLQLNKDKTATGKKLSVFKSAFDFTKGQKLGTAINDRINEEGTPFDDVFAINDHDVADPVVTLSDPATNRSLEIRSARNGLVVFTPDDLAGIHLNKYGEGSPYLAIALEAQNLSDATKFADFGDITLPAATEKSYTISYTAKF